MSNLIAEEWVILLLSNGKTSAEELESSKVVTLDESRPAGTARRTGNGFFPDAGCRSPAWQGLLGP